MMRDRHAVQAEWIAAVVAKTCTCSLAEYHAQDAAKLAEAKRFAELAKLNESPLKFGLEVLAKQPKPKRPTPPHKPPLRVRRG